MYNKNVGINNFANQKQGGENMSKELLVRAEEGAFVPGIYHFSNEGVCSWYDFAVKIMELGNAPCHVLPIESKDYPAKAARPHFSVLNKAKIKTTYRISIPHWEASLRTCIARL